MSRPAIAVLVLEIAAGIAAQASGLGGPIVVLVALALVVATAAYLTTRALRKPLVSRLRTFIADCRAAAPADNDPNVQTAYELDVLDRFRDELATDVRRDTRRLRARGLIGWREERSLNHPPANLHEIERLVDRLAEIGDPRRSAAQAAARARGGRDSSKPLRLCPPSRVATRRGSPRRTRRDPALPASRTGFQRGARPTRARERAACCSAGSPTAVPLG